MGYMESVNRMGKKKKNRSKGKASANKSKAKALVNQTEEWNVTEAMLNRPAFEEEKKPEVTATVVEEKEPEAVIVEPMVEEKEPEAVEAEPVIEEKEPEAVEAESVAEEKEPEAVEAEPEAEEKEPEAAAAEPAEEWNVTESMLNMPVAKEEPDEAAEPAEEWKVTDRIWNMPSTEEKKEAEIKNPFVEEKEMEEIEMEEIEQLISAIPEKEEAPASSEKEEMSPVNATKAVEKVEEAKKKEDRPQESPITSAAAPVNKENSNQLSIVLILAALMGGVLCVIGWFVNLFLLQCFGFAVLVFCFAALMFMLSDAKKEMQEEMAIRDDRDRQMQDNFNKELEARDKLILDLQGQAREEEEYSKLKKELEAKIQSAQDELALEIYKGKQIEEAKKELELLLERESSIPKMLPPMGNRKIKSVNLMDIAKATIRELNRDASKIGIQIILSGESDTVLMKADKDQIHTMFRNIIDNSIKYMGRKGSLIITISALEQSVLMVFKDNGNGLSQAELEHIFDLNYQGSNRKSGNGLGLTQAKAIVDYYGGTISARSRIGSGMGIYIQMPVDFVYSR